MSSDDSAVAVAVVIQAAAAAAIPDPWSAAFVKAKEVEEDGAKLFQEITSDEVPEQHESTCKASERDAKLDKLQINFHLSTLADRRNSDLDAAVATENTKKRALEEAGDEFDRDGGFRQPRRLAHFFKKRLSERLMA